jgi:hypothetical protein
MNKEECSADLSQGNPVGNEFLNDYRTNYGGS